MISDLMLVAQNIPQEDRLSKEAKTQADVIVQAPDGEILAGARSPDIYVSCY